MFLELLWTLLGRIVYFTGTIGSKSTFPKPLSKEDEERYLALVAKGDKEAKDILVRHNMRLVAHIVKKYTGAAETDDLISVGSIGLIKAIGTYKPGQGTALATYTARCIENEILMYLRKTSKMKAEVSLYEPLNTDYEGNVLMLSDVLGSDPDEIYHGVEEKDEKEMLRATFSKLGARERQIVELRFGLDGKDEMTQKEIADMMGISQSYISRLEKKIISQLKKEILKLGS